MAGAQGIDVTRILGMLIGKVYKKSLRTVCCVAMETYMIFTKTVLSVGGVDGI